MPQCMVGANRNTYSQFEAVRYDNALTWQNSIRRAKIFVSRDWLCPETGQEDLVTIAVDSAAETADGIVTLKTYCLFFLYSRWRDAVVDSLVLSQPG
jgi:hypothetical protein